jgi:hypothetical protein
MKCTTALTKPDPSGGSERIPRHAGRLFQQNLLQMKEKKLNLHKPEKTPGENRRLPAFGFDPGSPL